MERAAHHHLTLKILIGSAWADGVLEPEEIDFLDAILKRYGEVYDRELKHLLAKPVPLQQTERWMVEYLYNATETERQQLLGAIGNLLFSDRDIAEEEHILLDDFHAMMAEIPPHIEPPQLVKSVGSFVKSVVRKVTHLGESDA